MVSKEHQFEMEQVGKKFAFEGDVTDKIYVITMVKPWGMLQ